VHIPITVDEKKHVELLFIRDQLENPKKYVRVKVYDENKQPHKLTKEAIFKEASGSEKIAEPDAKQLGLKYLQEVKNLPKSKKNAEKEWNLNASTEREVKKENNSVDYLEQNRKKYKFDKVTIWDRNKEEALRLPAIQ